MPNFVLALGHFRCGLIGQDSVPEDICRSQTNPVNYIVMEKVVTTPDGRTLSLQDSIKPWARSLISLDEVDYLSFILQISHALQTAQDRFKLTHYDLHLNNVLLQRLPPGLREVVIRYPKGHEVRATFIAVIIDFEFARFEDERGEVHSSGKEYPHYGIFQSFNSAYDIYMVINAMYEETSKNLRTFLRPLMNFLHSQDPFAWVSKEFPSRLQPKLAGTGKLVPQTLHDLQPIDVVKAISRIYPDQYAFLTQASADVVRIPVPYWETEYGSLGC